MPPTINHCYGQARSGRRYMKKEGVTFKKEVELACKQYHGKIAPDLFSLVIVVETNWFSKAGKPLKKDITNRIKVAEDALAKGLGLDDALFFNVTAMKKHSFDTNRTSYLLQPVTPDYRMHFLPQPQI